MTIVTDIQGQFDSIMAYGNQVRFKYYNQAITGDYDDDITYSQSGTDFWTSGIIQPINSTQNSSDSLLLQQGKILFNDSKLYVQGTVQTSGLGPVKIGLGSPVSEEYQILEQGQVTEWGINGSPVYKKIYARILNNGSFIGE